MRATSRGGLVLAASLALAATLAGPGCGHKCGPGTYQDGDQCAAGMEVSCGPGTVASGGQCVPADGGGDEAEASAGPAAGAEGRP